MTSEAARKRLGRLIRNERMSMFGTKQAAYQKAGLNAATWDRIEEGLPVRDDRLAAAFQVLGWSVADGWAVLGGDEPPLTVFNAGHDEDRKRLSREELRESIENSDQPGYIKKAMLALLEDDPQPPTEGHRSQAG